MMHLVIHIQLSAGLSYLYGLAGPCIPLQCLSLNRDQLPPRPCSAIVQVCLPLTSGHAKLHTGCPMRAVGVGSCEPNM